MVGHSSRYLTPRAVMNAWAWLVLGGAVLSQLIHGPSSLSWAAMAAAAICLLLARMLFSREALWLRHHDLAVRAHEAGHDDGALHHFERSAFYAEGFGPKDNRLGQALGNQAALHRAKERYEDAEPLFRRAVDVYLRAQGPGPDRAAEYQQQLDEMEKEIVDKRGWQLADLAEMAQLLTDRKLVFFVGSAISMLEPSRLPSFAQMKKDILTAVVNVASALEARVRTLHLDALSNEVLYSAAHKVLGARFAASHAILDHRLHKLKPNLNHRLLAAFLRDARMTPVLFTTNFDELIELALEEAGSVRGKDYFVYADDAAFESFAHNYRTASLEGISIVKLHGTISEDSGLVARLDQIAIGMSKAQSEALDVVIADQSVMFAGYSGNDSDVFPKIVSIPNERRQTMYWNVLSPARSSRNLATLCAARCGLVHLVPGDLCAVLQQLATSANIRLPPVPPANTSTAKRASATAWSSDIQPHEALEIVGLWCLSQHEVQTACAFFERAATARRQHAPTDLVGLLRVTVSWAMVTASHSGRVRLLKKALTLAQSDEQARHVMRHMAAVHHDEGNIDHAAALLERALEFPGDYILYGHLMGRKREHKKALGAYETARALIVQMDSPGGVSYANIETVLGVCCHDMRSFARAIAHHKTAHGIYESLGMVAGAALALRNLGVSQSEAGDDSAPTFERAFELSSLILDVSGMAAIADHYDRTANYDLAFRYYRRLQDRLSMLAKLPRSNRFGYVIENQSGLHWGGDIDHVILEEAVTLGEIQLVRAFCTNKLGEIIGNKGDLLRAAAYFGAAQAELIAASPNTGRALRGAIERNARQLGYLMAEQRHRSS